MKRFWRLNFVRRFDTLIRGWPGGIRPSPFYLYRLDERGGAMNLNAVNLEVQPEFSELVDHFIKRYCRLGTDLNISDRALFRAFQAFWIATMPETQHPSLLGQFRVELTERGFRSVGSKRPRWYGLNLHQLTVISEKENERLVVHCHTSAAW